MDRETLIKRMKKAEKATPTVEESEKVGESVPTVEIEKVIVVKEEVEPGKGDNQKGNSS